MSTDTPRTEAGRAFVEAVNKALLDPSLASFFSGTGRPQTVAIVHLDAAREAVLAIEREARASASPAALDPNLVRNAAHRLKWCKWAEWVHDDENETADRFAAAYAEAEREA